MSAPDFADELADAAIPEEPPAAAEEQAEGEPDAKPPRKINLGPPVAALAIAALVGGLVWWLFVPGPPPELVRTLEAPSGPLLALLPHRDGQTFYLGTAGGDVIRGSLATGAFVTLPHQLDEPITSLAISHDDFLIAGNYGLILPGWNAAKNDEPGKIGPLPARANCIALHPRKLELVAGTDDGQLMLLTVTPKTSNITIHPTKHKGSLKVIRYSPNGQTLVSAGSDGALVWYSGDAWKQSILVKAHASEIGAMKFSADGQLLASGDWNGGIILWNVGARKELQSWKQPDAATCFDWLDDLLITGSWDGRLRFWSRSQDLMTREIQTGEPILDLCVLPESQQALTISPDHFVRVWNLREE